MQALAQLATEATPLRGGSYGTRVVRLRPDWPLMLRTALPSVPGHVFAWAGQDVAPAGVCLAAGAAGPLGGDRLRLEARVGEGSALVLGEISPTLLLPGPHGAVSRLDIRLHVGAGATLTWLPELTIAAHGCRHITDVRVTLEEDARLLLREEVLFGRHGEQPGVYHQRLRVFGSGRPLYDQELAVGRQAPGWAAAAITANRRVSGTLLLIASSLRCERLDVPVAQGAHARLMPLAGHGLLYSALASDTGTLRRQLDETVECFVRYSDPAERDLSGVSFGKTQRIH